VKVLVVRHAHALPRAGWEGDDADRVLSPKGRKQARALAGRLIEHKPGRVLSSPYTRCLDTVAPLATAAGLEVEPDLRLAEGEGRRALELARALGAAGDVSVLCSHGDVIPELLAALAGEDRVDLGPVPRVEKGSVWVLEGAAGRFSSATYVPPPKV
jgi:broad specificity phosphatase PhoE